MNNNASLSQMMNLSNTIKGIWTPRRVGHHPGHGHHHGHHGHHHSHGHHHCHGHSHPPVGLIEVDWRDTPKNQAMNAFIVNFGYGGYQTNQFLNADLRTGDIVFFGPEGTLVRYIPLTYSNQNLTLGELQELDSISNQHIDDNTIELDKMSQTFINDITQQIISASGNNQIINDDGLFVNNTLFDFDPVIQKIAFTDNLGQEFEADLSSLFDDNHVSSVSIDGDDIVLEFAATDSAPSPIRTSLQSFRSIFTQTSNQIQLSGNGTSSDPLEVSLKINTPGTGILEVQPGGLDVNINELNEQIAQYIGTLTSIGDDGNGL